MIINTQYSNIAIRLMLAFLGELGITRKAKMSSINWKPLYKEYKGMWVALKDDEKTVIASNKNISKVLLSAKRKGFEKPILFKVPTQELTYIG